jgi:serine/threonine-protein kinase
MGVVYRATDGVLGREIAVKVLPDRYAPDSEMARRFADEARIASQLQHPGIPPVHDLGTLPDGRPFLAMKLIKGETLEDLLQHPPDTSACRGRFVAVFEQVCQAVAYAHAHHVIHRDLKPSNVMVGAFGEVQVMDWGLAKVLGGPPAASADADEARFGTEVRSLRDADVIVTQAGSVLGTPAFMPPEQAAGAVNKIDARSDVFGLGGILAVILTGAPPFTASSNETTRIWAAQGKVEECFGRLDGCGAGPDLVALCKRCLAPDPADRPADASAVARAVAHLRAAADDRARQAELDRVKAEGEKIAAELQTAEQRKRRRVQAALGISFTALVVLGGAFAWWTVDQRRAHREAAERDVNGAIESGVARYSQAKGAGNDLALWAEARAEARAAALQAQERAADVPANVRERAVNLLAEIEQVEKNRRLVVDLLSIQSSMGDTVRNGTSQDFKGASARYHQAFQDYGADLDQLSPEQAADLLRDLGGGSTVQLAAALDDWAYVLYVLKAWVPGNVYPERVAAGLAEAARLFRVTHVLDPDPFRNRIRDAVSLRDAAELKRLAEACDPATQPVQTVNLMSVWYYWTTRDITNSVPFLQRAHLHHPDDFQISHNTAFFLNSLKRHADALPYSLAAIAIRPQSSVAWLDYAEAMAGMERAEEEAAGYRRVAELSPQTWWFRIKAGAALERLGRQEKAVAEYRKALATLLRNPNFNCEELPNAVAAWRKHGLFDELATGSNGQANAATYDELGVRLGKLKEFDGAIVVFREAIRLDPHNPRAHFELGNVLKSVNRPDEAIAAYREAIRLNVQLPDAYNGLASLLSDRGDYTGAQSVLKQAAQANPAWLADPRTIIRYNSARCAARTATGRAKDSPPTADRPALRRKALDWLAADLAAWKESLAADPSSAAEMKNVLARWLVDPDLAALRPGLAEVEIPAGERAAWNALWADVRAAIDTAP